MNRKIEQERYKRSQVMNTFELQMKNIKNKVINTKKIPSSVLFSYRQIIGIMIRKIIKQL